jgi:hypothetical protein
MKIIRKTVLLLAVLFLFAATISYSQEIPSELKKFSAKLAGFANSAEIVSSVKAQNAQNLSLNQIKEADKKWMEKSGIDDFMSGILNNKCSVYLKSLCKANPAIVEAFVMDNQGANTAMTNKTSDYWQGDEDKFTKSFNGGKGAVHFGKLSFDESAQTYIVQVSVPVKDNGKTIGAVTFGVDPSKIK